MRKAIAILTALFSFRLVAGSLRAAAALSGGIPTVFAIGGFGDALAGLLAPYVAWRLLRRPGAATWVIAALWQLYSACDFVFANAAHLIATHGEWFGADGKPTPIGFVRPIVLGTFVVVNLLSVRYAAAAATRLSARHSTGSGGGGTHLPASGAAT